VFQTISERKLKNCLYENLQHLSVKLPSSENTCLLIILASPSLPLNPTLEAVPKVFYLKKQRRDLRFVIVVNLKCIIFLN